MTGGRNRWAGPRLALATAVGFLVRNRARAAAAVVAAALGAGVLAATSTLAASAQAGVAQQFRDLKSTRLTASSSTMRPGWVTEAQLAHTAALPGIRAACLRVSASGPVSVRSSLAARPDYAASVYDGGPGCVEATGMTVSQGCRGSLPGPRREQDGPVRDLEDRVAAGTTNAGRRAEARRPASWGVWAEVSCRRGRRARRLSGRGPAPWWRPARR